MITKPTPSQIQAAGRRSAALVAIVAMATAAQAGMYVAAVPTPGANDYQITASAAAPIYAGQPGTTHPNDYLVMNANVGWKVESMLNFDVSSLAGKTVQSAALYLYMTPWEGTGDVVVDLHSLNGVWSEATVTWNNYEQGNFINTTMDSITLSRSGGVDGTGWVKLDVTPLLVQGWVNENPRTTSYGLGLVPVWQGSSQAYAAYPLSDATYHPVLVVTAVPEPGALCLLGVGGVLALSRRRR